MPIRFLDDEPTAAPATATAAPDAAPAAPSQSWGERLHNLRETLDASTTGLISGAPVVGPAALKVAELATRAPGQLAGMDLPQETITDRLAREHPTATTVGEVTGGLVAPVPVMRAFPILNGGTRMLGRAGAGAAIGGADAAIRSGGDPNSIAAGAVIGGAAPALGEVLAPAGSAVASGARWLADRTPGVRSLLAPKVAPATGQVIHDTADAGYRAVRDMPVTFDRGMQAQLAQQTRRALEQSGAYRDGVGAEAHAALDKFLTRPPTPAGIYSVVDDIRDVRGLSPKAQLALDRTRQVIEHFAENNIPGTVVRGQQQAARIGPMMEDNRANWRAYKNSQLISGELDKAEVNAAKANSGMNPGNNIRQRIASVINSKKNSRFLREEDLAALNDVNRGSWGSNAARYVSGLAGGGGGLGQSVTGGLAGFTGSLGTDAATGNDFNWGRALGVGLLGAGARKTANAITSGEARAAEAAIRASAPVSQRMAIAARMPRTPFMTTARPSSINAMQSRDEIARVLALQAEREAVGR